jgi:hypothetical protein
MLAGSMVLSTPMAVSALKWFWLTLGQSLLESRFAILPVFLSVAVGVKNMSALAA